MASQTPLYSIETWDDSDVNNKGLQDGDGVLRTEQLLGLAEQVDVTAGGTLTLETENVDGWNRAIAVQIIGTPGAAFTLLLPNRGGFKFVLNFSNATATLDTPAGSTLKPTLAAGQGAAFIGIGSELHRLTADTAHS